MLGIYPDRKEESVGKINYIRNLCL
jgi:hypothetical protein